MIPPEFSETSYGFALTSDLLNHPLICADGAPIFPSTYREGQSGGGWDVKIPAAPFPIFIQFKIPRILVRSSKYKPEDYSVPYYRFELRTRSPNQHRMLQDLESESEEVYYAAPLFHHQHELDQYFRSSSIARQSAFFRPNDIGELDTRNHYVSYCRDSLESWVHSNPRKFKASISYDNLSENLKKRATNSINVDAHDFFQRVARKLEKVVGIDFMPYDLSPEVMFSHYSGDMLMWIRRIAKVHLGCEFLIGGNQ